METNRGYLGRLRDLDIPLRSSKNIFAPPTPPPLNLWLRACHPYLQLKLAHAYHVANRLLKTKQKPRLTSRGIKQVIYRIFRNAYKKPIEHF